MKLWKCHYLVNTGYTIMEIEDYIWAVYEPDKESIGHYWKSLFPHYVVTNETCKESKYYDGMILDARMVSYQNIIK